MQICKSNFVPFLYNMIIIDIVQSQLLFPGPTPWTSQFCHEQTTDDPAWKKQNQQNDPQYCVLRPHVSLLKRREFSFSFIAIICVHECAVLGIKVGCDSIMGSKTQKRLPGWILAVLPIFRFSGIMGIYVFLY